MININEIIGGEMKRRNLFLLYSPLIKGVRGLFLSTAYCLLFTVFLWGCGADGGSAPPGSTITVNPASIPLTGIAGDTTKNLTITVTDEQGNPIKEAEVWISGAFAAPRIPARYQFCRQSDGVEPVNSSFSVKTDEFGTYTFSIIIPVTVDGQPNAFTDNIEVRSGSAYTTVSVTLS